MLLCSPLPQWIRLTYATNRMHCKDNAVWLLRLDHKVSALYPFESSSGKRHLLSHSEDTQAAFRRGTHGKELRSPAKSKPQLTSHACEPPCKLNLQAQSGLQEITDVIANILTTASYETLSQNYPAKMFPNSNLQKMCEINIYGFMLPSFGILCYTKIDN